ncbi:hypothetical protein CCHR01_16778 [Colletotrichum chrysophilum]|uniref:F-box domain-containing protein n=1 Tax=Colletotrichum chrysophilum TaxID=1836956 RepID=A0AAD9EA60_9PEZI|nr:hypothetical protein CCHR01_16778 [Colletotrichum chrysophilum]
MNVAPNEIVERIASFLDLADLRSLSLVDRRSARCCHRFIFTDVAVLHTAPCLSEFETLAGSAPLPTKHLWIYHGTWPACARDDWEAWQSPATYTHDRVLSDRPARDAFRAYYGFVNPSRLVRGELDQAQLGSIVSLLPHLRKVTISSVVRKRLGCLEDGRRPEQRHAIRVSPTVFDSIGDLADRVFALLPAFGHIQSIHIQGKLLNFPKPTRLEGVRELKISALSLLASKTQSFTDFMTSFPNLTSLSLSPYRHLGLVFPLHAFRYPSLQTASFAGFWLSRSTFLQFFERHGELSSLVLEEVILSDSNWAFVSSELGCKSRVLEIVNCY